MDYQNMTTQELIDEKNALEGQFNEYKSLLEEVYNNMEELSQKYNQIEEILKQRNG